MVESSPADPTEGAERLLTERHPLVSDSELERMSRGLTLAAQEAQSPCTQHPDLWFDSKSQSSVRDAKAACVKRCDVREQCLAYAVAADERYGVWGGRFTPDGYPLSYVRKTRADDSM